MAVPGLEDERRQQRALDERQHAVDPRRLFVADATLAQSRNPVQQVARAMRSAAQSLGTEMPRLVTRDQTSTTNQRSPWWTRPEQSSANLQEMQHHESVRRALATDSGGRMQPGEGRKRPNTALARTDEPSESRPYKRQSALDHLTAPATVPEAKTRPVSIGGVPRALLGPQVARAGGRAAVVVDNLQPQAYQPVATTPRCVATRSSTTAAIHHPQQPTTAATTIVPQPQGMMARRGPQYHLVEPFLTTATNTYQPLPTNRDDGRRAMPATIQPPQYDSTTAVSLPDVWTANPPPPRPPAGGSTTTTTTTSVLPITVAPPLQPNRPPMQHGGSLLLGTLTGGAVAGTEGPSPSQRHFRPQHIDTVPAATAAAGSMVQWLKDAQHTAAAAAQTTPRRHETSISGDSGGRLLAALEGPRRSDQHDHDQQQQRLGLGATTTNNPVDWRAVILNHTTSNDHSQPLAATTTTDGGTVQIVWPTRQHTTNQPAASGTTTAADSGSTLQQQVVTGRQTTPRTTTKPTEDSSTQARQDDTLGDRTTRQAMTSVPLPLPLPPASSSHGGDGGGLIVPVGSLRGTGSAVGTTQEANHHRVAVAEEAAPPLPLALRPPPALPHGILAASLSGAPIAQDATRDRIPIRDGGSEGRRGDSLLMPFASVDAATQQPSSTQRRLATHASSHVHNAAAGNNNASVALLSTLGFHPTMASSSPEQLWNRTVVNGLLSTAADASDVKHGLRWLLTTATKANCDHTRPQMPSVIDPVVLDAGRRSSHAVSLRATNLASVAARGTMADIAAAVHEGPSASTTLGSTSRPRTEGWQSRVAPTAFRDPGMRGPSDGAGQRVFSSAY